jgi:hypothetical protein
VFEVKLPTNCTGRLTPPTSHLLSVPPPLSLSLSLSLSLFLSFFLSLSFTLFCVCACVFFFDLRRNARAGLKKKKHGQVCSKGESRSKVLFLLVLLEVVSSSQSDGVKGYSWMFGTKSGWQGYSPHPSNDAKRTQT